MNIATRRTGAFVAALALSLSPLATGVALAQTNPVVVPANKGGIDFAKTGSLTVMKKKLTGSQTPGDPATGEEMGGVPGEALEGVTFTAQRVNVPLNSDEGWKLASQIANGDVTDFSLGTSQTVVTGSDGSATFNNLELGLYLVTETDVPEGIVPSKPFFVFVPMTSAGSDGSGETTWNYDPIVYPKNTESNVEKEVEDADQNVGDSITYTITSDVPALADDDTVISKYEVYDDLDEEQLVTTTDDVTLALSDGTTLTSGTHYTVTVDSTTQEVDVIFTEAGRALLTEKKRANSGIQVVTKIVAEVTAIGDSDGVVKNDARTITNNGGGGGDTTTDSNEVVTKWGKLIVNKENEEGEKLQGATFELYRCDANSNLDGDALTVDGESSWTTDANGAITVDGLHITDLENHDDQISKYYCLVEIEAPAGYAKLVEPVRFQLSGAAEDAVNIQYTADVVNVDDDDFLPSTGGMGVGLIIAAGAALIGAGAFAARRNSSKA